MYTLSLLSLHPRLHFVLRRIRESRSFSLLLDMIFHCVSTYLFLSFLSPQPPSWVSGEIWRCDLNLFRIECFLLFFMKLIFKVGLGISRTNADSQWNPVYNIFQRNFGCGNETIRR